jgi:hypothetical protein
MVYSGDFTFLALIYLCGFAKQNNMAIRGLLLLLVVVMGTNNLRVLDYVVRTCERMLG